MFRLAIGLLVSSTAFSYGAKPRFELTPNNGEVISVACHDDSIENCDFHDSLLSDYVVVENMLKGTKKKKKSYPGLGDAPSSVANAIGAAADALGDVSYVHVAVTHDGITYEYMYDSSTGWNSFRKVPTETRCTLKCMPKIPGGGSEEN